MSAGQDPITGPGAENQLLYLVMGKLRKPHGIRGEMVMTVLTEYPDLLVPGQGVYVGEGRVPLTIQSVRWHRDDILILFEEYADRDQVGVFRNQMLYVREEDFPELPEDEFYVHELIGMEVVTDEGRSLGFLKDILITGANDVYLVQKGEEREVLLPVIEEVVLDIDFERERILVHLLPGLIEES